MTRAIDAKAPLQPFLAGVGSGSTGVGSGSSGNGSTIAPNVAFFKSPLTLVEAPVRVSIKDNLLSATA